VESKLYTHTLLLVRGSQNEPNTGSFVLAIEK